MKLFETLRLQMQSCWLCIQLKCHILIAVPIKMKILLLLWLFLVHPACQRQTDRFLCHSCLITHSYWTSWQLKAASQFVSNQSPSSAEWIKQKCVNKNWRVLRPLEASSVFRAETITLISTNQLVFRKATWTRGVKKVRDDKRWWEMIRDDKRCNCVSFSHRKVWDGMGMQSCVIQATS